MPGLPARDMPLARRRRRHAARRQRPPPLPAPPCNLNACSSRHLQALAYPRCTVARSGVAAPLPPPVSNPTPAAPNPSLPFPAPPAPTSPSATSAPASPGCGPETRAGAGAVTPPSESDARSIGPPVPNLVAAPSLGVHGDLDPPLLAEAPSTPLPQGGHPAHHHPSSEEPRCGVAGGTDGGSRGEAERPPPPSAGPAPSTPVSHLSSLAEPFFPSGAPRRPKAMRWSEDSISSDSESDFSPPITTHASFTDVVRRSSHARETPRPARSVPCCPPKRSTSSQRRQHARSAAGSVKVAGDAGAGGGRVTHPPGETASLFTGGWDLPARPTKALRSASLPAKIGPACSAAEEEAHLTA
ncbi:predicted GPI-anchored protein 58 [Miscanthus floridulus]|uniref:predicted GPI-anchored protein 58 n=1 Tax=Miscanthus floridulus TaxID=154761 RepID=UPI003458FC9E